MNTSVRQMLEIIEKLGSGLCDIPVCAEYSVEKCNVSVVIKTESDLQNYSLCNRWQEELYAASKTSKSR